MHNIEIQKINKRNIKWNITISLLAFFISLFLSLMSENLMKKQSIIISLILLLLFMSLNVLTDMIGLAISYCQIDNIKKITNNSKIFNIAKSLVENADKASSILSDVVGDICGILCGVSGATFSVVLSAKLNLNYYTIFVASIISAIIASLTVLFKSISKNYAINNSTKIVFKISKILSKFRKEK